jgi:hypothetical protein
MKITCFVFLALLILLDIFQPNSSAAPNVIEASLDKHVVYAVLMAGILGVVKLKKNPN